MADFKDLIDTTLDTNYEKDLSLSQRLEKAKNSVEWQENPLFNTADAMRTSRNPVNRVYDTEDLHKLTSDAGTIAWDTFRKGVLDLASLPDKTEMALGNTLAGLTGDRVGTEMRDRAYDNLMKTMEDSRFIDSNYGDAETWTARFTGGAMSMGEMLAIGALSGGVGLGAFVGTTSLSDGALNDMANYYAEHGNLDGYETDPVNLAMDYGNAIFQVGSEMLLGTGRLLNGRVLKHGSAIGATVKETVNNFIQEFSQGLAADATEVLKGNEDVNTLLENAGGYVKDGIVGGVLGGVTGGTFYRVNKGRGKGSIKEVLRKLYPQKNEKELDDGAEEIWAKTEEKGLKTFVPEIVAHTEAVNDKGKIRENIRQKVAMMYEDADMSEKEKAKAIEATTTLELENILYDSIERKVPLTAHPLLQGEVNELGWFRTGIPEHRRAEIDALNKELADLKAQQKELMSAQEKDYNKLEEIETKIEQFRKNLPEKLGDLVVSDRQQVNDMLRVQRNRVAESMKKRQVLQSIKERARKASEKQDKADAALAEKMATGAEKAREQRVKKETAEQTKEAKVRTLTEQREIASAIKSVKVAVKERKQAQNRELRYAIEQATDESLRNVLKNRNWNAYTVDNMKRRQLVAEVKQIPNLSMLELVPMSRRDISYQQEVAESKQEKTKTAKGFFHRKINREFANQSGILQAWGYSKDDSAINLVFVKDGGYADWDEIVMALQEVGALPLTYAETYETTDAMVDRAKDIVLNNKELTESMGDMTQSQVDYTADRGEELLLDAGYTPEQIQAMSFQEMSDILSKLYAEDVAQQELADEQLADLPDIEYQDLADENARLDEIYPEYKGETINIDGKERTVYNGNGERIAKSEPALRNFWNWFGDSKVVDDKGRPLVVYHGSPFEFNEFSNKKASNAFDFSTNKDFALYYARDKIFSAEMDTEPFLYSVYLKADNPFDFSNSNDIDKLKSLLKDKNIKFGNIIDLDFIIDGIKGKRLISSVSDNEFNNASIGDYYSELNSDVVKKEDSVHNYKIIEKNDNYFIAISNLSIQDRDIKLNIDLINQMIKDKVPTVSFDRDGMAKLSFEVNATRNVYNLSIPTKTEVSVFVKKVSKASVAEIRYDANNWEYLEGTTVNGVELDKFLQENGYDAYLMAERNTLNIGVFEPNQIKSTQNRGTFSPDTGNIYKQTKATGKGKDVRGAFVPEYRFIAKTGNLDASTLAHELAHDWGQENFRWARSGKASESFLRAWGAVEKAIGITDKDIYFTYDASEKFARAYEGWLLERKDWADILHINTDEEKKAVEEAMEDYRKELVDIYESLTNPYFTMAWGKTGELKPELKEWFERSTKYDELDSQVARGEITEEQASGQKLQDMLESATESTIDGIPVKDKNAIQAIEDLDKLREQEKRFETEGGNTNRIQRRLNAIALAKDMVANNEALGKYDTHRDMLAVAEAADIFVNTRLNDALAIINGKMPEQDGLYASDLYTALERKAKAENDFELVEELRNSLVAKQLAKELGQRVAGFRNYTASGDVDIMSTLKSLDKLYDKAYNEKEREQLEEDVKAYFESVAVADSQLDLDGFFNELECK